MLVLLSSVCSSSHSLPTATSQQSTFADSSLNKESARRQCLVQCSFCHSRKSWDWVVLFLIFTSFLSAIAASEHVMVWTPNSTEHGMYLRMLLTFLNLPLVTWMHLVFSKTQGFKNVTTRADSEARCLAITF